MLFTSMLADCDVVFSLKFLFDNNNCKFVILFFNSTHRFLFQFIFGVNMQVYYLFMCVLYVIYIST